MTDEERDTLDHLREQRDGLEKQVATLRAELAAERERADNAERREGNLRDHIVHFGKRSAKLREALVKAREMIVWTGGDKALATIAAIDAVLKEIGGGDE